MKMIAAVAEPVADDPVAEAVALADTALIAAAEAALAEAEERFRAAQATAEEADAAAGEARAEMPALVERAVAGETVTAKTIAGVRQRVRDAEAYSAFTAAVARRLGEAVAQAKAELAETRHQAWLPVLERAISMRINAARRADRARLAAQ
jgi:hypothetical protein